MTRASENMIAVVTGAGSGIGQATALRLSSDGFSLALVGRDKDKLLRTKALLKGDVRSLICIADIAIAEDIEKIVGAVESEYGRIDVLINAAGMNIPLRSIIECSAEDYARVLAVNLTGAFLLTKGFLPFMRLQNKGTIVNVVSDSGLRANNFAGAAYISSKFGLKGFTESINAEERLNGIRATAIHPGEVNTPILDKRAQPPSLEQRARMLQAEDVAECISLVVSLPFRAIVEEIVIRPSAQDWVSRR